MLGAIIGDVVGSRFEWHNLKSKEFDLLTDKCFMTDDSYMTIAVADALMNRKDDDADLSAKAIASMQRIGRRYPDCGFGGRFYGWVFSDDPRPYHSYGNGAAMRVSACGYMAETLEEAKQLALAVTRVSHDHPEGLKAAEAETVAVYMALHGASIEEIRKVITEEYYPIDFTLDEIRASYEFDVSSQGTMPPAFEAFFESTGFEDAIRNAISVGGDSDTLAAITGGIAEAYWGIPEELKEKILRYIDDEELRGIVTAFEQKIAGKVKDIDGK